MKKKEKLKAYLNNNYGEICSEKNPNKSKNKKKQEGS